MPEKNRNSYSSILKATGLFGGVKVFEILISIIRSKFVAVLLGPGGMGVYGLITSPLGLIKQLTGFGLGTSGVRDVSKAYSCNDVTRKDYVVSILRKLVWVTGLLGFSVAFVLAKQLSLWSFGNTDYTLWYRLIAVTLLIDQIVVGQKVLMQGTFHYSYLAKSTVWGNVIGLVFTIPLFYFMGVKGVVPVIVLHSLTTLFLSWFFASKIQYTPVNLSIREVARGGATMMGLGLAIALTGTVTLGKEYLLRIFISNMGDVADVGLFNAGIAMATQYIGVVLTAMSSDYIPRLSAASSDLSNFNETINRQLQLLIVIIGPLVGAFIVYIKEIVVLLYSNKFLPITGMIEWIMLGMFFRSVSFCLSYAVVAKADSKRFFWNELVAAFYSLVFYALGYYYYSFEGMGIAYCFSYICYSAQMYLFSRIRYGFRFETKTKKFVIVQMGMVIIMLIFTRVFLYTSYRYVLGSIWLVFIMLISYKQMDQMIDIKNALRSIRNKLYNGHKDH